MSATPPVNHHDHSAQDTPRKHNFIHRHGWLWLVLIAGGALLFLTGFSPWGGGYHRDLFSDDPAKMEAALTDIENKVADYLDIRAEQEPAFNAFAETIKARARQKITTVRPLREQMHAEMGKDLPDVDTLAALAKQMLRQRPPVEETDALIDDAVAFYKTLDADQQAKLANRLKRHGRWHH